ncbi:bifunctional diguanylate cyclase/phosphodiesterase [Roseibium sp. RKSG952]|uniref:putative bifunctional diguanylate cyclase/phosphodiesterase n=1 Tax=Roseibium sp. RKSG952 TaxID=2529384 RepID=UPI0018AD16EB|nr:EAL domain-containing protein [Roseibium sp. RKSG952]
MSGWRRNKKTSAWPTAIGRSSEPLQTEPDICLAAMAFQRRNESFSMPRQSVQNRYFLIAAPIAFFAILAVALWNAKTVYDNQVIKLDEKLERILQNQTIVMSRAMGDRDERLLKLIGASLVADPDIVFVHINDETGNTIASLGRKATHGTSMAQQINVRRDGKLTDGGSLELGITYKPARELLQESLVFSAFSAFLAIFAIWLGGFLAFRYMVGRPIETLHQLIDGWKTNQWSTPKQPLPNNEFGSLTAAFVELHETVQARESELKSIKAGLEIRVAERTEELRKLASTDALTGLANRRAALEFAEGCLSRAAAIGEAVVVFAIDLDYFKALNDQHGHAIGDQMLCHASRQIEASMPDKALVARMGGDEFIAIAPCSVGAAVFIEKTGDVLVEKLSLPVILQQVECQIGASVGVATEKSGGTSFEKLLANADLALYDAKNNGRGTSCQYDADKHTALKSRRSLADEITQAIYNHDFEPYFQPQLDLWSGEIISLELLARWQRGYEQISVPKAFLSAIEDGGFSNKLDMMILEKGLDALIEFHRCGAPNLRVSANASTASLHSPVYVEHVLSALKKRNLPASCLAIEVLEETMIRDPYNEAAKTIQRLSHAGVRIELDDFGVGYSSLSQLALLPLHGLKLDRSLVSPLPGGQTEEIVRAISALCKELDISITAEGIETQKQFEVLHDLGCDFVQGYLISPPLSFSGALSWIQSSRSKRLIRKSHPVLKSIT